MAIQCMELKVRGSQASVWTSTCTELNKAQFPVSIVKEYHGLLYVIELLKTCAKTSTSRDYLLWLLWIKFIQIFSKASTFKYGTSFWPKIEIYFHDERSRFYYWWSRFHLLTFEISLQAVEILFERSRFSWSMVEIFAIAGRDFYGEQPRFSWWTVVVLTMAGRDLHNVSSRIAYCFG